MPAYMMLPSMAKFVQDTGPAGHDATLRYITDTLNRMPPGGNDRFIAMTDLFFGLNGWIKAYHEGSVQIRKPAYPAVAALTDCVIKELQKVVGAPTAAHLSRALSNMFGLANVSAGRRTDANFNAITFDKGRRELSRLHFRNGLAFRARTPDMIGAPPGPDGLTLVQSRWFETDIRRQGVDSMPGFAPFVMSLEREFYMARHEVAQGGIFHSAYFGDGRVGAAGTMLIETGRVLAIRSDSGHFRPPPRSMASALKGLQAKGLSIDNVTVYDFKAHSSGEDAGGFVQREQQANPLMGANQRGPWQRGIKPNDPARMTTVSGGHRPGAPQPNAPVRPGTPGYGVRTYGTSDQARPQPSLYGNRDRSASMAGPGGGPARNDYGNAYGVSGHFEPVSAGQVLSNPNDYN